MLIFRTQPCRSTIFSSKNCDFRSEIWLFLVRKMVISYDIMCCLYEGKPRKCYLVIYNNGISMNFIGISWDSNDIPFSKWLLDGRQILIIWIRLHFWWLYTVPFTCDSKKWWKGFNLPVFLIGFYLTIFFGDCHIRVESCMWPVAASITSNILAQIAIPYWKKNNKKHQVVMLFNQLYDPASQNSWLENR